MVNPRQQFRINDLFMLFMDTATWSLVFILWIENNSWAYLRHSAWLCFLLVYFSSFLPSSTLVLPH